MKKRSDFWHSKPEYVRKLYEAFEPYQVNTKQLQEYHRAVFNEEDSELFTHSLADLPPEAFYSYAFEAMWDRGNENDFKHFLPRMLELSIDGNMPVACDMDWVANKLSYAKWPHWKVEELEAVRHFWNGALSENLRTRNWEGMNYWAQALDELKEEANEFTAEWESLQDVETLLAFAYFVSVEGWAYSGKPLADILFTKGSLEKLEQLFLQNPGASYADKVAEAVDILRAIVTIKEKQL